MKNKMAQKKKKISLSIANALAIAIVVALIILSSSLIVYTQQNSNLKDENSQIGSLQKQLETPKLIIVGIQYMDNQSNPNAPFLQVTGYVVNVGTAKALNCTIHITALQGGNATGIDNTSTIGSLDAGASESIDLRIPYTGQPLMAYTSYLAWTTRQLFFFLENKPSNWLSIRVPCY